MTTLEPGGVYDGDTFTDVDLGGEKAGGARFLDCRFERCAADGLRLGRARFNDCALVELRAVELDLAGSQWIDSHVDNARLGAVSAYGAELTRTRLTGGKTDYLNLRGAVLTDVTFQGAVLGEVDLGDARLTGVRFVDCRLDVLTCSAGTQLEDVDLTGAALSVVNGLEGLRGAVVSESQLFELAPLLAAHLGIAVRD